ncbi:alpha/beta fold hydrolase [Streptomyces gardneri]|uniref:alpha/beta fold hydrolase n=1 Tax=Nocardia sputi TaxID=2943705 RepID=UPI00189494A5|nr:alpha/beta fold hydrolase [Nocardia sputi]MBF6167033.1 alpha/beta fold hydrolase [Streptomyces gardneri]MBF6204082.1 alpha/beta fold hydrolase [Streptomyces gardneri]UAK30706.1 alpha/beta fold hydrolase [Nocardia asteroides]
MTSKPVFTRLAAIAAVLVGALAAFVVPVARAQPPTLGHQSQYLSRVESRYVDTELARFHYTRTGTGSPVVLVAGGGLWGYSWRDVIPALAAEHTVYAVDLPSQGFTELHRGDFAYDLPAMSQALATFLDAVGLHRTALVGHSWGGAWSLYFAEQHSDRVERLVLLDSPGLDAEKAPVTPLFTTPVVGELATDLTTRSFYADNIRGTFHNKHLVTEEVIDELYAPFSRPANRAGFLSLWRNMDFRLTDAGLARVAAPTLVLWGGADSWLPASQAGRLAARIPDAAATVLPNCGHTVHEDCPAQTNPLITGFLR